MKSVIAALALTAMLLSTAFAGDHLYPEPSVFGGDGFMAEYDRQVVSVLKDAMDRDVILRMIFLPSFVPESVVGVRKRGGQFEIFSLQPSEQIWNYGARHTGKLKFAPGGKIDGSEVLDFGREDPKRMPIKVCSIQIPESVEQSLAMTWENSLRAVRFDGGYVLGGDGAFYHFAMRKEPDDPRNVPEFLAGQVWSGGVGPRLRALIELTVTMDQYCATRDAKTLNMLIAKAEAARKVAH